MHVGQVVIFRPGRDGFDYEKLVGLVDSWIGQVPRLRQRLVRVPGNIARPVWIDDPDFDLTYHVRRSGLPRPGSDEQLFEFCARIESRRLDRTRPLWEVYLIEGLDRGRIALASKVHQAVADSVTVTGMAASAANTAAWSPRPAPSGGELLRSAVVELGRQPARSLGAFRSAAANPRRSSQEALAVAADLSRIARTAGASSASGLFKAPPGESRRFAVSRTAVADYLAVAERLEATLSDVVLAAIAGALRGWLLLRGGLTGDDTAVRAMLPAGGLMAETEHGHAATAPTIVDLPVGDPDPLARVSRIRAAREARDESHDSLALDDAVNLVGLAPPPVHALGVRAAASLAPRLWDVTVTGVIGPFAPFADQNPDMVETFPITPLYPGQALSIALTSHRDGVFFGLNADRDICPDVEVMGVLIEEALAELVTASSATWLAGRRRQGAYGNRRVRGPRTGGRSEPRPAARG